MIQNIIFDFGAVLIPIEPQKSWDAFSALGADTNKLVSDSELFHKLEKGNIDEKEFYDRIRPYFFRKNIIANDLRNAWNQLLKPLPEANVHFLRRRKKQHKLFLLSNTNAIHIQSIRHTAGPFLYNQFRQQFQNMHFSHEMGMRKPEEEIFKRVLDENELEAAATLFIDDNEENIETAQTLGLKTWHYNPKKHKLSDIDEHLT